MHLLRLMIKMTISDIELITDPLEIKQLYDFIKRFPLDYPSYAGWVQKCYEELLLGSKKAFVCKLEGEIIGDLVFQRHKQQPRTLEIKNLRIAQQYQRRKIASRFLREVEEFARSDGSYNRLIVDTHADNLPVIKVFQSSGFVLIGEEELYDSKTETVLAKDLT